MSFKASMRVWKEKLSGSKKLVKLCLADFANEQWQCWPSLATIAERTGLSRRYTIGLLNELESDGEIKRAKRGTTSTLYTLVFKTPEPASEAGITTSEVATLAVVRRATRRVMQGSLLVRWLTLAIVRAGSTRLVREGSPEQSFNSQFERPVEAEEKAPAAAAKSLNPGDLRLAVRQPSLPGQAVYPEWPEIPDAGQRSG